jgi:hypothetical protein
MLTGTGLLAKFWRETCEQATHYKKLPMLIAHQNQQPTICWCPRPPDQSIRVCHVPEGVDWALQSDAV